MRHKDDTEMGNMDMDKNNQEVKALVCLTTFYQPSQSF